MRPCARCGTCNRMGDSGGGGSGRLCMRVIPRCHGGSGIGVQVRPPGTPRTPRQEPERAVRKMNKTCKTHAQNRCLKSVRKIRVIWSQNGIRKGCLKRPKAYIFRHIFACYFRHVFDFVLGSKMHRKWVQKGVQNVTKNHENRCPRQSAILERFGADF